MKTIIAAALIFMAGICQAQKLNKTEIDKFNGAKRVETDELYLYPTFNDILTFSLRSSDTTLFLNLRGTVGVGSVGPSDPLTFLLEDKTMIVVYPTSIQSLSMFGKNSGYRHQYRIAKTDIDRLSQNRVLSMRRQYNSNYRDLDLKTKE